MRRNLKPSIEDKTLQEQLSLENIFDKNGDLPPIFSGKRRRREQRELRFLKEVTQTAQQNS